VSLTFKIEHEIDIYESSRAIKEFAINFGLESFESSLLACAVSEASTNALRYANGCEIYVDYTENKKGISIAIEDDGKGIKDLSKALVDGYSSLNSSLGLGFGAMSRSVDKFNIDKSDSSGTSIKLLKYLNRPDLDSAKISIKKNGESFNGDACFIKHYEGDKSFFAILDASGSGLKANQAVEFIESLLEQYYDLELDSLVIKCHSELIASGLTNTIEIAFIRILDHKIEYIVLGNTFIQSNPPLLFTPQKGSIGLHLPENLQVFTYDLAEKFCILMASDGMEIDIQFQENFQDESAVAIATHIFNNHNLDDDSSLIVIKNGEDL